MQGRIVMITGANAGIGKATAQGLAKKGATVVMVARDRQRGQSALAEVKKGSGNDDVHLMQCDLAELDQVRGLAADFKAQFSALHVLINNAGVIPQQRQQSADGYELQFAVNHLAHFLLTNLLLGTLKASAPARIINVSSMVHRWGEVDFTDLQAERAYSPTSVYADTKLMNVLFTYELARRLEGTNVTANALHPGEIATKLHNDYFGRHEGDPFFGRSIEEGARTPIYLASSRKIATVSGKYFANEREQSAYPDNEEEARRLWEVSAELAGL